MRCNLCPNACNVDRSERKGVCGVSDKITIAAAALHFGEEPFISGTKGSGAVFFCGCSLKCAFCQNYELSRNLRGKDITVYELSEIFKRLEGEGAHNINLVNPTHYYDKILSALELYKPNIPVIANTHGYESLPTLERVFGAIDVFLPDMKFVSPAVSLRYTGKRDYFELAKKSIEFMSDKPLSFAADGTILSGAVIRHLCLPQNVSDSKKVIDWYENIKDKAYLVLMSQYIPFGEYEKFPELKRKLTLREYNAVVDYAISKNLKNVLYQKTESASAEYIPKWQY